MQLSETNPKIPALFLLTLSANVSVRFLFLKHRDNLFYIGKLFYGAFFSDKSTLSSNDYDITLMTLLLKHLANISISDVLPFNEDYRKGAAVSRIKYYRNQIFHSNTGILTEEEFHTIWDLLVYKVFQLKKKCAQNIDIKIKTSVISLIKILRIHVLLDFAVLSQ